MLIVIYLDYVDAILINFLVWDLMFLGPLGKRFVCIIFFIQWCNLPKFFFQNGWTSGSNKMTELVNQPFFFNDFQISTCSHLNLVFKKTCLHRDLYRFVSMISSPWFNYLQLVPFYFYTGVSNPVIVLQPQWHAAILCLQGGRSREVNAEKPSIVLDRNHWN